MKIQCTRNIAEHIPDLKPGPVAESPFFTWSVHQILVGRRQVILVMHTQSRYCLVLTRLRKSDLKLLEHIVTDAIRRTLQGMLFRNEIIEAYLSESGPFVFTRLIDRHLLGGLNVATQTLRQAFRDILDPERSLQTEVIRMLNRDIARFSDGSYDFADEAFLKSFIDHYGPKVISTRALVYRCVLEHEGESIERVIALPDSSTFRQLNLALQTAFGWGQNHLYQFRIKRNHVVPSAFIISLYEEETGNRDPFYDHLTYLFEFEKADDINYVYDLGETWEHTLTLIEVREDWPFNYPVLLDGKGTTPPEDGDVFHERNHKYTPDWINHRLRRCYLDDDYEYTLQD